MTWRSSPPRTSHSVVKIDVRDANDVIELRLTLEIYALRSAGAALSRFPVDTYRAVFSRPDLSRDHRKFIQADAAFHSAILASSSNQRLPRLYAYLQNLIQVLSVQAIKAKGRMAKANSEHLEILDAIENNDLDFTINRLENHFGEMRAALLRVAM